MGFEKLTQVVPQQYGEATKMYDWIEYIRTQDEWDNSTTLENAAWLVARQADHMLTLEAAGQNYVTKNAGLGYNIHFTFPLHLTHDQVNFMEPEALKEFMRNVFKVYGLKLESPYPRMDFNDDGLLSSCGIGGDCACFSLTKDIGRYTYYFHNIDSIREAVAIHCFLVKYIDSLLIGDARKVRHDVETLRCEELA